MGLKRIGLGLALLLGATQALATNDVTRVNVRYHSSLASVAVTSIVHGDDDTSHVCRIFHGLDRASDSGMVMVRRQGTNMCEGRILWMGPNDVVKVQVEVSDAGSKIRSDETPVMLAQVPGLPTSGTRIYVHPTTGNNNNAGTSPASPKRTLNTNAAVDGGAPGAIVAHMQSPDSGAYGGIVLMGGGIWHENASLTYGRDGKPRFITGDRTNRDSTIICGCNEHGEAGRRDVTNAFSWSQIGYSTIASPPAYPPTEGVYKALLQDTECATCYGDSISSVIIGWGEYLHRKTSLLALFADSTGSVASANKVAGGEPSGWFLTGDTLYVKRRSKAAPPSSGLHFGYRSQLITIAGRNWMVKNLTVRFAGGPLTCNINSGGPGTVLCSDPLARYSAEDPPNAGHGIINSRSTGVMSSGLVVDSVRVYGCVGLGVYAAYGSDTERADSATVANSIFDGLRIGSMQYREAKDRLEEDANILKVTGSYSNVYRNLVTETHNGIQAGPNANPTDTTWGNFDEIYGNTVRQISDDAFELDTAIGTNMLVWNNVADVTNTGVSIAPLYTGPAFVIGNTFTRFKFQGVKTGFVVPGQHDNATVSFLQNTFITEEPATSAWGINDLRGRHVFQNNVMAASKAVNGFVPGSGSVALNYNALDSTFSTRLVRWNSVDGLSWTTWQATGNDANSIYGNIGFVGLYPPAGKLSDVRILSSSPARRAGRRITGVNTDFRGNRYTGNAPDIGAQACLTCARASQYGR